MKEGRTFRLNQNHRWERADHAAPGQLNLFGSAPLIDEPKPKQIGQHGSEELAAIVEQTDFFGPHTVKFGKMPSYSEYLQHHRQAGTPSPEEAAMLSKYTDQDYKILNNHIAGGKTNVIANLIGRSPTPDDIKAMDAAVELLNRAFNKVQPEFKGTVYRGEPLSRSRLSRYVPGSTFTIKAFLSTSQDEVTSQAFGGLRMVIESKGGKEVSGYSQLNPEESEVLFKPGTRFNVQRVQDDGQTKTVYLQEV